MNLKRIRKAKGLTLSELADKIGMDQSTVQRAEAMNKTAKLETYMKCAQALGVTLSDIFSDDFSPIERQLVVAFRALDPKHHALLHDILDIAASAQPPLDQ